ncbi:MAG TPA: hypothetical protein VLM89_00315 [Phycisphaerae bacterium]|nr:hypothetical protein [Phycisphaerae bacterium]
MKVQQDKEELQQRVCRACQQTYTYPVLKSTATRFYCEACTELPVAVRSAFEKSNRRLKDLAGQVERLRQVVERGRQAE